LTTPFEGWFGDVTSVMAGLYLIGFTAPAFEAAACHVGETIDPNRNVPRAMLASGLMAGLYFIVLPVVWLGVLGPQALGEDLATVLGPTFAPLFGSFGKAAAIWFIIFNMFHGTLQPLAGAARTMSQLSDDGLLPRFLGWRIARTDCPWAATALTAGCAIIFLIAGDPIWMIAAANFTYLIGICMPNVAAWLLRRDQPNAARPYRAPRGTIVLGVVAASIWLLSAILGFQQFGLPTVLFGLALAYSGAALYAWRVIEDRKRQGLPAFARTLHVKLTGAMLFVLIARRDRLSHGRELGLARAQRAGVGAGRYLRRGRAADDYRRSRVAGDDHLFRAGGKRGRQAPDVGNAARFHARNAGPRARRPAGRARLRQHRARKDQLPR
jgi:amino acid transporter